MYKISVIIPVYNTEKYLTKCLDSVCNQTLSDIEIICINDCSTDNSLEILKRYAKNDSRIKIINFTENKGAAIARNTGIQEAQGEYLGFIDSDDYVDLNFYEKLYAGGLVSNSDIVKGSDMILQYPDGRQVIDKQNEKILENKINFWFQYTTAIFKRNFIIQNFIDFPVGLLVGEDPVFTIKSAILSNSIHVVSNAQYYYVRRENSLNSDVWDNLKIASYIDCVDMISDFILEQNLSDIDNRILFNKLLNNIYKTRECKLVFSKKTKIKLEKIYNKIIKKSGHFPLKILFDTTVFSLTEHDESAKRGIYFVAYNLVQHFFNDKRFDVTLYCEKNVRINYLKTFPMFKDKKFVFSKFQLGESVGNKTILNTKFNKEDYDLYLNPEFHSQLFSEGKPLIFNILYDAIPMLETNWIGEDFRKYFYNFYKRLKSSNYAFCISNSCKIDFLRFFPKLDEEKLKISYISSAQCFKNIKDNNLLKQVLQKYNIKLNQNENYVFYIGSANDRRKNLVYTIECFINFIEKYQITDLYFFIGGSGKEELLLNIKQYLGELYEKYQKYIITLGFIAEEDVNVLYSNSLFFSFLSLYEGFGMPPLEAMQAGVPVICANNSSLPEVVGDAALLVDGENEEEIVEAFAKFYFDKDLRDQYIQKGLQRAKEFSWEETYKTMSSFIIKTLINESI